MATDTAAPPINLLDPQFYVDPWDAYRWMRDEAPAFWDPVQEIWGISRYDDIVACEKDAATYSSLQGSRPKIDQSCDTSMINMDEPAHQAQRNLVARKFTPRAVRDHEDHVRQVVTEILDAVTPLGECEAVEAIASRLPAMMITELLGYPPELWEKVRYWSEEIMYGGGQTNPAGVPHTFPAENMPAVEDFWATTGPLVQARKAEPHDDLISTWVQQGWDDGQDPLGDPPRALGRRRDDPHRDRVDDPGARAPARPAPHPDRAARRARHAPAWRSSSAGCRRCSTCAARSPATTSSTASS